MRQQRIKNFPLNIGPYRHFVSQIADLAQSSTSAYVCVANAHMFVESDKKPAFSKILQSADMVTPDGMPLVWALKWLYNIKQDRVAGMDLIVDLLKEAERKMLKIYLYGGTQEMLVKAKEYIKSKYPHLFIAGITSPPFRPISESEAEAIIGAINDSGAQMVLVILGCPKQEIWMASMKGKINAVMVGIGGALPVLIGLQKRAPKWMQQAGLEWLFRLGQEPKRLFKRYAVTNTLFLWLFFKEWIKLRVVKQRKILTWKASSYTVNKNELFP